MQSISAKEQRGRLRADQRIVGYGRFSPVQSVFSVDQTQWGTEPIEHEQVEMSIGRADTSGRSALLGGCHPMSSPTHRWTKLFGNLGSNGTTKYLS